MQVDMAPFGEILGVGPMGINVYSCNYESIDRKKFKDRDAFKNFEGDVYLGYKWQCVELARRWVYKTSGLVFGDIPMAYDIFRLNKMVDPHTKEEFSLFSFPNGSKRLPEPGCLLIWDKGGEFEMTGHVAVVTEVLENKIKIIEQNVLDRPWKPGQDCSRELSLLKDQDDGYWIECNLPHSNILGWVVQTEDSQYSLKDNQIDKTLFSIKMTEIPPKKSSSSWLNIAKKDERAYVEMMGGQKMTSNKEDERKYFCISKSAERELIRATNELHMMFMHATDYVIHNPNLLSKFCIPKVVWPKLFDSWQNRRNQMLTGRFDFSMSKRGLKVYEYNADSSSCYMETGKVQIRWSEHFGVDVGQCTGKDLQKNISETAKELFEDESAVVHLLFDDEPEEKYHTLFFKNAFENAGLNCKEVEGIEEFEWGKDHSIVDKEGTKVSYIWKTWAWETVLDQIREECEADIDFDEMIKRRKNGLVKPRLIDILLNPEIKVTEPFWTIIPSNKSILPVLSELFPNHPYILKSSFKKSSFKNEKIVIKPISGRCGLDIVIEGDDGQTLDKTKGRFSKKDRIFQKYFPLPKIDRKYVQLSTFSVNGQYSGACARYDYKKILTSQSDLLALRIIDDVVHKKFDSVLGP